MKTGSYLKQQRMNLGMSRRHASEDIGVAYDTMQNWERSLSTPNSVSLRKLVNLYGFDLEEYLLYYRESLVKKIDKQVLVLKRRCG